MTVVQYRPVVQFQRTNGFWVGWINQASGCVRAAAPPGVFTLVEIRSVVVGLTLWEWSITWVRPYTTKSIRQRLRQARLERLERVRAGVPEAPDYEEPEGL